MGGLDDLQTSVGHLWDEVGSTNNPIVGLAINLGLAALGVVVWYAATGWVSFAGAVWGIVNMIGIISWVFRA